MEIYLKSLKDQGLQPQDIVPQQVSFIGLSTFIYYGCDSNYMGITHRPDLRHGPSLTNIT